MIGALVSTGLGVVQVDYGFDQVVACTGEDVQVNWKGYHNLQEVSGSSCTSPDVGSDIVGYFYSGHVQTFSNLAAEPGETRYFKCDLHCSGSNARFEVSCPPSLPPPPPPPPPPPSPTPLDDVICIDARVGVLLADGSSYKSLGEVSVGTALFTKSGRVTHVRDIVTQHAKEAPYVVLAGTCGATVDTILSPAHAVRCDGKWTTARDVGKRLDGARPVTYTNLQTDDYCSDELILDTGLVVETWDGRQRHEWRPHAYENGERINCV